MSTNKDDSRPDSFPLGRRTTIGDQAFRDQIGVDNVSAHYLVDFLGHDRAQELLVAANLIEAQAPLPDVISKTVLWEICIDNINRLGDEGHGFLARKLPKFSWNTIFASVGQMGDLSSGLKRFVELVPLLQSGLNASVKFEKQGAKLTIKADEAFGISTQVERYIDLISVVLQCFFIWTAERDCFPVEIRLPATLEWEDGYMLAGIADCNYIRHGNGVTMTYDRNDLNVAFGKRRYDRWGMPETTVFKQIIANLHEIHNEKNTFIETVKNSLARGPKSQSVIAKQLGLSVPTLQRKLAGAGTNFRQLSQEIRKQQLCMLLSTSKNLDDVAEEMGFSDRRSLTRACHEWLGMTPSSFRKKSY